MSCRLTIATTVVLAGLAVTACSDPAGGDLPEAAGSNASTSSLFRAIASSDLGSLDWSRTP